MFTSKNKNYSVKTIILMV